MSANPTQSATGPSEGSGPESTQADGKFFPIPLAVMRAGTMAPVDLYIRGPDSGFVLYRAARTPMRT